MPGKAQTPEITSAKDWRKGREEGVVFHFPSGLTARVKPVSVSTFIAVGHIPDILSSIVQKLIGQDAPMADMPLDDMRKAMEVYDIFCKTCFLCPVIVDEVKNTETEITLEDISDTDKQTLFAFMGSPASALAAFRPLTQNTVDDLVGQQSDTSST